jgi:hypothetical protein
VSLPAGSAASAAAALCLSRWGQAGGCRWASRRMAQAAAAARCRRGSPSPGPVRPHTTVRCAQSRAARAHRQDLVAPGHGTGTACGGAVTLTWACVGFCLAYCTVGVCVGKSRRTSKARPPCSADEREIPPTDMAPPPCLQLMPTHRRALLASFKRWSTYENRSVRFTVFLITFGSF